MRKFLQVGGDVSFGKTNMGRLVGVNNIAALPKWWSFGIALLETCVLYVLESAAVQMGFCMETTGMTQGLQAETHCAFAMDSVEDSELRDETESMDDDQDREVEWQLLLLQC